MSVSYFCECFSDFAHATWPNLDDVFLAAEPAAPAPPAPAAADISGIDMDSLTREQYEALTAEQQEALWQQYYQSVQQSAYQAEPEPQPAQYYQVVTQHMGGKWHQIGARFCFHVTSRCSASSCPNVLVDVVHSW